MQENLQKNIIATIIYYDGLEYPLTAFEIWKYLIRKDYYVPEGAASSVSLLDVMQTVQNPECSSRIEQYCGFYFLKGKKHLVNKRIANMKHSAEKIKRLRNIAKLLRFVPYVRMVGMTGGLAMKNAKHQSDWDLLIVTEQGKIWTARTLVTMFVHALGKRRHDKKVSNRVCLNFFVTTASLEVITKDLYSASEYMFLFPLYGWKTYQRFQIKNQWIKNMKPNYALGEIAPLKILPSSKLSQKIQHWGEWMFAPQWIEKKLKKIEKKRIMQNPKTHQEGSLIYADDDALVFLPSPHGPKLFEMFKEKSNELNA